MNKILVALFVVLASSIFGLIFVKQIKVATAEMAEVFARNSSSVAGTSTVQPRSSIDTSDKLERSLNSFDLEHIDSTSAQIEAEVDGL